MEMRVVGVDRQSDVVVEDVRLEDAPAAVLEAYRVRPTTAPAAGAGPGVVWAHWFDPEAPDGDRGQFLDEARDLAALGVTSLLPQGRFPWSLAPSGAAADRAAVEAEVQRLLLGLDVLGTDASIDAGRLALVGHDFGGMTAIVAAASGGLRLRGLVVIAATARWGDWFLPFWPIADDRIDYLRALRPLDPVERIGEVRAERVLLQMARQDFFIAPMTGLELQRAAPAGGRLEPYDDDHAMRSPVARDHRRAFLLEALGLPGDGGD